MSSKARGLMPNKTNRDEMAEMGRWKQGFCGGRSALNPIIFRSSASWGAFVLFGMLALGGCQKTETETKPSPVASTEPSAKSASKELSPQQIARTLALQKPSGSADIDREIEILQKATEKNPDSMDAWIWLGRAWARKARRTKDPGFWLNTQACAKIVLEREPKNAMARTMLAMVLLEQHAFADAKDAADQLLLEDKDNVEALGVKSDALLELGQFEESLAAAQKMMDIKPNLPSYARAAHLRWLQGDAQAAKSIYRAAFDARDPRDPEPFAWVLTEAALIFWHEGDIEGADKGFDKALDAFPDEPTARLGKARVALAQGNAKQAAEHAERVLAKTPLCEAAWVLGDARAKAGDEKGAEEAYKRLIECGRKSDPRTLAAFFATKNRDIDEAVSLAKQEAKVRQDIRTRDVLAWALYRKGDFTAARKESDAAIAHGTKEPLLLYHAGAIRIAQGEKKDGDKWVREALTRNPHFDPTAVAEAKQLLGEAK